MLTSAHDNSPSGLSSWKRTQFLPWFPQQFGAAWRASCPWFSNNDFPRSSISEAPGTVSRFSLLPRREFPFYKPGNQGPERFRNMFKFAQFISRREGARGLAFCLWPKGLFHPFMLQLIWGDPWSQKLSSLPHPYFVFLQSVYNTSHLCTFRWTRHSPVHSKPPAPTYLLKGHATNLGSHLGLCPPQPWTLESSRPGFHSAPTGWVTLFRRLSPSDLSFPHL